MHNPWKVTIVDKEESSDEKDFLRDLRNKKAKSNEPVLIYLTFEAGIDYTFSRSPKKQEEKLNTSN